MAVYQSVIGHQILTELFETTMKLFLRNSQNWIFFPQGVQEIQALIPIRICVKLVLHVLVLHSFSCNAFFHFCYICMF